MKNLFPINEKDLSFMDSKSMKYIIIIIIILSVFFIGGSILLIKREKSLIVSYKYARDFSEKIEGVVKRNIQNKSIIMVDFTNGGKFSFLIGENYSYRKSELGDFLSNGDSIVKPALSDTLYIYRDNQEYFFVMGKRIEGKK